MKDGRKMDGKRKVMVIGLDGATFDLIKPWAQEARLPTFKKLLDEGAHGNLLSTIPFATIPAWPSFSTGMNPGKHGFYDFFKEKNNSYDMTVEIQPSRAIKQPALWDILSRNNKSVAIINVPSTFPPSKVNGYMVTGMLTPPNAKFTYPPEFQQELKKAIGDYNVFFSSLSSKDVDSFERDLEQTLESRVKAVEYLWTKKEPDFLMMVDNGTDRSEHELWRFLDPLNPLYNVDEVKKYGDPLLRYYQKVDEALAKILGLLDENTTLIIMSDHGQGPLHKFVNLNIFLLQHNFMTINKGAMSKLRWVLFKQGFSPRNLYNVLKKLGVERFASDRVSQERRLSVLNKLFFSTSDIDWTKTKAFASGVTGAITLNVKDRQPQGIVSSGQEYEDLRTEIIDRLSQLKDAETDAKVVRDVYKREEIYQGAYLDKAPDIVATPSDGYEFFGMHGFSFSRMIEKTFGNSGSHRPNGIFMAWGNGVEKGLPIEGARIVDVAPTVLNILGMSASSNIDGKVLKDVC